MITYMDNKKRLFFDSWGIIAGPCAAENLNQIIKSAKTLKKSAVPILFKISGTTLNYISRNNRHQT